MLSVDTLEQSFFWILIVGLVAVRVLAPFWIGRSARKRGKGHAAWIVSGLIIGPLIVGLVYLCTAYRAQVLPGREHDPIL
jgi:hypothetical protein